MAEKKTEIGRREERGLTRREPVLEPFMRDRFVDEMDRVFDDVFGRGWLVPRLGRSSLRSPWRSELEEWAPDVEVFHRNNELVVRADLPGLTKDDLKVDVTEDHITLQGERTRGHEEEKGGVSVRA
jgi:HSP20 family protein